MGITVYRGRVRRALMNKENSVYWLGIGRTTAWDNEASPPSEEPTDVDIEEAVCFVKPDTVSLCKIVESDEDFTHNGTKYAYVDDGDAFTEGARYLYLKGEFDPSEGQPYGNFRQVGVFANLTPSAGHESDSWLAPANVDDVGDLEYIDHDIVTTMSLTRKEVIEIVIEFR